MVSFSSVKYFLLGSSVVLKFFHPQMSSDACRNKCSSYSSSWKQPRQYPAHLHLLPGLQRTLLVPNHQHPNSPNQPSPHKRPKLNQVDVLLFTPNLSLPIFYIDKNANVIAFNEKANVLLFPCSKIVIAFSQRRNCKCVL